MRCRDKIEQSAPPGTARGTLYKARRDMTALKIGQRKIDFSDVQKDSLFREWSRVFNNVEEASL